MVVMYLIILIGANASFEYMTLVCSCLFKVLVGYLGEQPRLFCGTDSLMLSGWSKSVSAFQHSCDERTCAGLTAMVER